DQRPEKAPDATNNDGDETRHDQAVAHWRREAQDTGGEYAGKTRENAAETEIQCPEPVDIDPERRDGFQIARTGADAHSDQRTAQRHIEPDRAGCSHHHDQDAEAGNEEIIVTDRRIEDVRYFQRQALRAPDLPRHILDD